MDHGSRPILKPKRRRNYPNGRLSIRDNGGRFRTFDKVISIDEGTIADNKLANAASSRMTDQSYCQRHLMEHAVIFVHHPCKRFADLLYKPSIANKTEIVILVRM
jgi:hypothetical protein